jgi:hypothetical protein
MGQKEKKSINHYMRSLHRDIGFFVIGLTIIYCISGILLIYRDTSFLKNKKNIERQLVPNLSENELGMALHSRNFAVIKTKGDSVYFKNGTYNKITGLAKYTDFVLPSFLERFNKLHTSNNRNPIHVLSVIFGILLLFLAISSFWMFKPDTKLFKRGICFAAIGILAAIILLLL